MTAQPPPTATAERPPSVAVVTLGCGRNEVDSDQLQGKWKQVKGKAQETWGKLTNDDLDVIEGKADQLACKIQERYGKSREEAEKEVEEFCTSCNC